jgi:RNA polymerase sigma factor (sigma-70 family)
MFRFVTELSSLDPIATERILIEGVKNRDQKVFERLYDNYSGALLGVVLRIVNDQGQAEEILQEVFVKIWNNIGGYDPSKARLFTWMLNIARNAAIDATRSKQYKTGEKNQRLEDSVNKVNRIRKVVQETDHIGLKELVGKLKPENRQIIDLMYFGGYTQDEIAKEFDMPLGTVKTRARAGIQQLRELMGEDRK